MDTQNVEQGQEDLGNRSAIEDAINSLGGDDGNQPGTRNDGVQTQTPQTPSSGVAPRSDGAPPAAAPDKGYLANANAAAATQQQAKPQASLTDTPARPSRAPQSWRPELREEFSKLPPPVQAEVLRREREVQTALQDSASARQFVDKLVDVMHPYQQMIAMEGDVVKVFGDYLKTSATLRMGTPIEKANAIAQAVRTFGVDVGALDSALTAILQGQQPPMPAFQQPGGQQPQQQQQFQDPRVDQILAALQAKDYESQQQTEYELDTEIAEFASNPKNEFFEELRDDISMLLASAAQRGKLMSLEQAYNYAATMHPQISKVVSQRQAAANAKQRAPAVLARQNAASSIRSSAPAQTGSGGNGVMSVRESIEAAIDGAGV